MDDLRDDTVRRRDVADRVERLRNYDMSDEGISAEYRDGWDDALCLVLDVLYGYCYPDARIPSVDG